jgi:Zn-dependent protease
MSSLVAILFAIVLLLYAQLLRSVLARPFRKIQASILPPDTGAPQALADLYQRAEQELTALGFERPVWVLHEYDPPGLRATRFQVYRHVQDGSLVWLGPPVDLRYPNRLVRRFSTRLVDGRTLCSQGFDPYFQVIATAETPRQRLTDGTLEQQWAQHRSWRAQFDQAVDPQSLEDREICEEAGTYYNLRIDSLVERQRLWRDSSGVARARLGFGLRILGSLLRKPARMSPTESVPPARLAELAEILEQARSNGVPAGVQWALFAISIAMFLLLGGLLWNLQFVLILLGVIAFHEAGHYLAMRGFGYHNVQMLMLPLVGGVTLGVEKTSNPAQRAWMSLMGPLPGIVLGWILYGCLALLPGQTWAWLRPLATTLLVLNYLNVLPLPPLDGSRVVQALLPARWTGLQAIFLAVASVVGGLGITIAGYPRLGLLAFLTLATVRFLWQRRNVVRVLLREGMPEQHQPAVMRLTRILEVFERLKIPMRGVQGRLLQAESVLQIVDTGAMATRQRVALTGVYGLLMIVPVVAIAGYWGVESDRVRAAAGVVWRGDPQARLYASARREALAKAVNMDVAQFVTELRQYSAEMAPEGLSEADIEAVEGRLGVRLPEDIRAVYRLTNGLRLLQLAPLEQATKPDAAFLAGIAGAARDGEVEIGREYNTRARPIYASVQRLTNTVRLGWEEGRSYSGVLVDLNQPSLVADRSLILVYGTPQHVSLMSMDVRGRLQEFWVARQAQQVVNLRYSRELAAQIEALRGEDVPRLLAHFPEPGFLARTLFRVRAQRLPEPASEAELVATERRLGQSLPQDLRSLLLLHNGYPRLSLSSVSGYFPVADNPEERRGCVVIGVTDEADDGQVSPRWLWCSHQIVNLETEQTYPDITALLREDVARQMVNSRLRPVATYGQ